MPHVVRHMLANGCLFLAAVRRALVLAADLFAQLPQIQHCKNPGLARCGHQLGQQYCPKQNMANSRLKYKVLAPVQSPNAW